ncbi:DUF4348 domain-containing protein [Mucilaginibacter terrigena]|uniref:DUF4348 domain-containing protein n=1 Tax=Mucilaginibacter terrigena TaxID=2492395 RepID=A0A4Q5LLW8_9SPHI|nr:DUF4348 domain-containing protein [Mucilaginibacter terrigena]RYU90093.1 DUF4348 domain-containing protein [Mucilaginibacter terrigena]
MKRSILLIALLIGIFLGCSDPSSKTNVTRTGKSGVIKSVDFDTFFKEFKTDSLYQLTHVKLPLALLIVEEEGTITKMINKKDLKYLKFPNTKETIYKKHQVNQNQVIVQYMIEDTGISVNYNFDRSKGQWQLVFIKDESD